MRLSFTAPVVLAAFVSSVACERAAPLVVTVAHIERVRAGVSLREGSSVVDVTDLRRLVAGAVVTTDGAGRAIVALDHGDRVLLDHDVRVRIDNPSQLTLDAGRVWIGGRRDAPDDDPATLSVGAVSLALRGVRASVSRAGGAALVDVLAGEVAWRAGERQGLVRAGESARIDASGATVTARTLFDDWTGGLADELPAGVDTAGAVGLGAVAARRPDEQGAPRWPLALQRLDAHVAVVGDLAITELDETFFNPTADTVEGLYTLVVPRGAVLQRFAVDRRGALVDGFVRERNVAAADYQAQVYRGSTHDPALLEWDAPGRYHARLFPIAAGATRRVRVTYTQWLSPGVDGRRAWRLPLASLGARVGELRIDVDVSRAQSTGLRASEGAVRDGDHLTFSRSDTLPVADFVLDLEGPTPPSASVVRVPASGAAGDRFGFVRVAVQPPFSEALTARDEGVDLVVVVDHSAATDPGSALLGQAFAEALVRSLSPRDRLLVLAGDVSTRSVGAPEARLATVTDEARQRLLDALANDRRGGATDLGAMFDAAHAALDPRRNGVIVYVGDGDATVGEADVAALRARLARMDPHPRLYAIAVGDAPKLDVLAGIAAPTGFAARVARRAEVARTAIDVLEHATRPLVRGFQVDLGPDVERVYPVGPVDVPAGEPLVVVGRAVGDRTPRVTVRARWNGEERVRSLDPSVRSLADRDDLRARWASARLDHLLATGEPRAVVVELGTRFGLVTPFTSFYVPSEDEPLAPRDTHRESDLRWSLVDLIPLVGCARLDHDAREEIPAPAVAQAPATAPAPSASTTTPTAAPQDIDRVTNAPMQPEAPSAPGVAREAAQQEQPPAPPALMNRNAAEAEPTVAAPPPATASPVVVTERAADGLRPAGGRRSTASRWGIEGASVAAFDRDQRNARDPSEPAADEAQRAAQTAVAPTESPSLARCSDAAAVTLAERVSLWRERLAQADAATALRVWNDARRACELPAWPDRVAMLRLLAQAVGSVDGQIALYRGLARDAGARAWMRDVLLRTLARRGELARADELGLGRLDATTLSAALAHAVTPRERLSVLLALSRVHGDDFELALLVLDAAVLADDRELVRATAAKLREDPRTDARARTVVGEALFAIGDEGEARRAFSEIVEFAPEDPAARQRLGDIALAHGWAQEAYRQFQTLAALRRDAPEILLRLAWAARAAGRFDESIRLAERVTTAGGPGALDGTVEAAAAWIATELALAAADPHAAARDVAALRARWRRSPAARGAGAVRVVLRALHPDESAELWVATRDVPLRRAELVGAQVPLEGAVWSEVPAGLAVEVRRAGGGRPRGEVELVVLWNEGTPRERVVRQRVRFEASQSRVRFDATDGVLAPRPEPDTDVRLATRRAP